MLNSIFENMLSRYLVATKDDLNNAQVPQGQHIINRMLQHTDRRSIASLVSLAGTILKNIQL